MKRWLTMVLVMAFIFPMVARAATDEVPPKEDKILAGYDKGFIIRSANEHFRLKIGGRHQVQYYFETIEQDQDSDGDGVADGDSFSHSFVIPRSRVILNTTLFEKFNIVGWFNHSTSDAKQTSWTVFSSYTVMPEFVINFGMVGIPFDFASEKSSGGMLFVGSPLATGDREDGTDISISRNSFGTGGLDLGLGFSGDIGSFGYAVAIGNGQGKYSLNTNNEFVVGARVYYSVFGSFSPALDYDIAYSEKPIWAINVGGLYQNENDVDAIYNADGTLKSGTEAILGSAISGTIGTGFRWRGFALNAEGYYRRLKVEDPGTAVVGSDGGLTDVGYYANASYFVIPKKLALGGVISQVFREGPDNNMFQFGGALDYFPLGNNNVKWQLTYDYALDYDAIAGTNDQSQHYIRTMVTIQW